MPEIRRTPLVGFNHNLRYRDRVYHVQTEDSGPRSPVVRSHVFIEGTVLQSASMEYAELVKRPDHVRELSGLMREQHKDLMRQLLRGKLDARIVELFGSLEPDRTGRREKTFNHRFHHAGRDYAVRTRYHDKVITELSWQEVLIATEEEDCSERLPPGSPEVERLAQTQHKRMLLGLRDGEHDTRIAELFGALEPMPRNGARRSSVGLEALMDAVHGHRGSPDGEQATAPGAGQRPRIPTAPPPQGHPGGADPSKHYHHRVAHQGQFLDLVTCIHNGTPSRLVSELYLGEHLLTRNEEQREGAPELLRQRAQQMHKQLLRDLRDGELEEVIELAAELDDL